MTRTYLMKFKDTLEAEGFFDLVMKIAKMQNLAIFAERKDQDEEDTEEEDEDEDTEEDAEEEEEGLAEALLVFSIENSIPDNEECSDDEEEPNTQNWPTNGF